MEQIERFYNYLMVDWPNAKKFDTLTEADKIELSKTFSFSRFKLSEAMDAVKESVKKIIKYI